MQKEEGGTLEKLLIFSFHVPSGRKNRFQVIDMPLVRKMCRYKQAWCKFLLSAHKKKGLLIYIYASSILKSHYLQAQDVNFAMEASRKSQIAFAAANPRMEEAQNREGIISVKRALDVHFQDLE